MRETHPDIRRGATARDMRASTRLASGAARCPRAQAPRRGPAAREEARTRRGLFPRRSARWARSSARVPSPCARWRGAATRRITSGSTPRGSRPPASASGTSAGGSPTTTRRTGVASPPHPSRQVRRGDFPSPDLFSNRREKSWKWRPLQNVLRFFPVVDSSGASAILSLPRARAARRGETSSSPCVPLGAADEPEPEPATQNRNRIEALAAHALVRCPANLAFAVPPAPPNPFPAFVPDETWSRPDIEPPAGDGAARALDEGADTQRSTKTADWRRSSARRVRLAPRALAGAASRWAPYLAHLPASYDLLSCWTDEQLGELRCAELEARARRSARRTHAHAAVAACDAATHACASLTYAEMEWGLDTVRSRGFLGTSRDVHEAIRSRRPHPPYPPRRKDAFPKRKRKGGPLDVRVAAPGRV